MNKIAKYKINVWFNIFRIRAKRGLQYYMGHHQIMENDDLVH